MLCCDIRGTRVVFVLLERCRLWPLWGCGGGNGRVFWLSERNGERLKSRHRYYVIERSEFGCPEVCGRCAAESVKLPVPLCPIKASLSVSERMRRCRMSCRAFGLKAWLPSLTYQRTDIRKSADTFQPIGKVFWYWSVSGNA